MATPNNIKEFTAPDWTTISMMGLNFRPKILFLEIEYILYAIKTVVRRVVANAENIPAASKVPRPVDKAEDLMDVPYIARRIIKLTEFGNEQNQGHQDNAKRTIPYTKAPPYLLTFTLEINSLIVIIRTRSTSESHKAIYVGIWNTRLNQSGGSFNDRKIDSRVSPFLTNCHSTEYHCTPKTTMLLRKSKVIVVGTTQRLGDILETMGLSNFTYEKSLENATIEISGYF
ncbi:hypothetical protein BDN70DRAFT_894924 [Pholiota conissans]|uniref:Uncharacterized protein n=1 Tax=Pholiota conissans TaxID=109636 RepID=A0A9P5Z3Z5_9AGAR|nr:hypothetical protein BDN70DRAFT_894924 [Pholiota conissans]